MPSYTGPGATPDIEAQCTDTSTNDVRLPSTTPTFDELPSTSSDWRDLSQSERRFGLLAGVGWLRHGKPPPTFRRFDAMRVQLLTLYMIKLRKREVLIGHRCSLYTNKYDQKVDLEQLLNETDAFITDEWLTDTIKDLTTYTELLTGFHSVASLDRSEVVESRTFLDTLKSHVGYAVSFPTLKDQSSPDLPLPQYLGTPLRDWSLPGGTPDAVERLAHLIMNLIRPFSTEKKRFDDAWDAGEGRVRRRRWLARFLIGIFGSICLLFPVITLYFITSRNLKISLLAAFTLAFSFLLSLLGLPPPEALSGIAAFVAVLAVFISSSS